MVYFVPLAYCLSIRAYYIYAIIYSVIGWEEGLLYLRTLDIGWWATATPTRIKIVFARVYITFYTPGMMGDLCILGYC